MGAVATDFITNKSFQVFVKGSYFLNEARFKASEFKVHDNITLAQFVSNLLS